MRVYIRVRGFHLVLFFELGYFLKFLFLEDMRHVAEIVGFRFVRFCVDTLCG